MLKRLFAILIGLSLAIQLPVVTVSAKEDTAEKEAPAKMQIEVPVCQDENAENVLTEIEITGPDAPEAGKKLDDEADVKSAEGKEWTIPVIWVNNNTVVTQASEGSSPMPVLLFIMPEGYHAKLNDNGYADVTLSEYLTERFGNGVVTLAVPEQAVTYITAIDFDFSVLMGTKNEQPPVQYVQAPYTEVLPEPVAAEEEPVEKPDYVSLYASNTARDAIEAEELARVLDIIINCIQPQAVNLLENNIPAFKDAANNGELSHQIGMYAYYKRGDGDKGSHWASGGQAAVTYAYGKDDDGNNQFGMIVTYNLDGLLTVDENGQLVLDEQAGEWKKMESVIVHEFMHAFMLDYVRSGMVGISDPEFLADLSDGDIKVLRNEYRELIEFPTWFVEGAAETVTSSYVYHNTIYTEFKNKNAGADDPAYTIDSIRTTYAERWYQIAAGTLNAYSTGCLAMMYLYEMAAAQNNNSSMSVSGDGKVVFDSQKLKMGMNEILERLHNGETLDEIIYDISNGLYADTEDFEARFINGNPDGTDDGSAAFCVNLLNYWEDLSRKNGSPIYGSVLIDFDDPNQMLIDPAKEETSELYNLVGSNDFTESDAVLPVPYPDGGKSINGTEFPSYAQLKEEAARRAAEEWNSSLSEVDWQNLDQDEIINQVLDITYDSNVLNSVKEMEGREDYKQILSKLVSRSWDIRVLFMNNGIDWSSNSRSLTGSAPVYVQSEEEDSAEQGSAQYDTKPAAGEEEIVEEEDVTEVETISESLPEETIEIAETEQIITEESE